jgi:hypothetical protein
MLNGLLSDYAKLNAGEALAPIEPIPCILASNSIPGVSPHIICQTL